VRSNGLAVLTPFNLFNNTVDRATLLADLCIVPSRLGAIWAETRVSSAK